MSPKQQTLEDPVTGTRGGSQEDGWYSADAEFDSAGINVGLEDPYINLEPVGSVIEREIPTLMPGLGEIPDGRCTLDGIAIGCDWAQALLESPSGAVVRAPSETTRWNHDRQRFEFFQAYANGFSGFMGMGDTVSSTGYNNYEVWRRLPQSGSTTGNVMQVVWRYENHIVAPQTGFFSNGSRQRGGPREPNEPAAPQSEPPASTIAPRSGPCDLQTAGFGDLGRVNPAALALLQGSFGNNAASVYGGWSAYNQAVFLNTVAAVADAGVSLGNAQFHSFYTGSRAGSPAFGVEVTGVGRGDLGTLRWNRSPGNVDRGSVEASFEPNGVVGFDVDLWNPFGGVRSFINHLREVVWNKRNKATTHPADAVRGLNSRGVQTGVTCR